MAHLIHSNKSVVLNQEGAEVLQVGHDGSPKPQPWNSIVNARSNAIGNFPEDRLLL